MLKIGFLLGKILTTLSDLGEAVYNREEEWMGRVIENYCPNRGTLCKFHVPTVNIAVTIHSEG